MNTGLRAQIFRWSMPDCSNKGISSKVQGVTIVVEGKDVGPCLPDESTPAVKIVRRKIVPWEPHHIHAEFIDDPKKGAGLNGPMHGGNFIYSSDSRYAEITGVRYPIAIHDRWE